MKIPSAGLLAISNNVNNESVLAISKSLKHNTVTDYYSYGTCSPDFEDVSITCVPSMLQASLYNLEHSIGERSQLTLHIAFLS
jgi:hypothetical protein